MCALLARNDARKEKAVLKTPSRAHRIFRRHCHSDSIDSVTYFCQIAVIRPPVAPAKQSLRFNEIPFDVKRESLPLKRQKSRERITAQKFKHSAAAS